MLQIANNELIVLIFMVAFARATAKSIFSKLRFTTKSQLQSQKYKREKETSMQKEISSNYFLEAIKSGGIWLS